LTLPFQPFRRLRCRADRSHTATQRRENGERTPLRVEPHPAVAAMGSVGCEGTTTTLSSLSHRSSAERRAEHGCSTRAPQTSTCSAMARASSTSTKITHRALDLPMPQKKLYRSQVAFTAVNAVSTSSMLSYHALNVPWGRLQCMLIALLPASPWRGRRRKSVMLVREPQAAARKVPGCAAHTL
jgi:hypothetical protein